MKVSSKACSGRQIEGATAFDIMTLSRRTIYFHGLSIKLFC
jgi:hypothetical protein